MFQSKQQQRSTKREFCNFGKWRNHHKNPPYQKNRYIRIWSYANRFPPNHSQILSSVIKDILLRYAQQRGYRSVLYENEKKTTFENDSDYQWTLERLGCIQHSFKAEHPCDATNSDQKYRIYNKLCSQNLIYRRKNLMPYCVSYRDPYQISKVRFIVKKLWFRMLW